MARCNKVVSMRPSAFYVRKVLRTSKDLEELRDLGHLIINEHERLREWVRAQGLIPPKFNVIEEEAEAKGQMGQPDADLPECDGCEGC